MTIYLVTPLTANAETLDEAIKSRFEPNDVYRLQAGRGLLLDYKGTSVELSSLIGLTSPEKKTGSAIIVPVTSYYGRGPADMWEWLKTRMER